MKKNITIFLFIALGVILLFSGNIYNAQAESTVIEFPNPLRYNSVAQVAGAILLSLRGVMATIAIIVLFVGGIMYMTSAGNETTVTRAKQTISGALIGLAIILAAPSFLKEIKTVLGGWSGQDADQFVNQAYTMKDIAISILNFLLSVTGFIAIISLIVGAVMYLTSYGDEDKIELGKKIITGSLIGIVIALASLVIVKQLAVLFGQA